MKYMNYLILIIIILLLLYNIHKRQYTQIESFLLGSTTSLTSSSIDDSIYNYKAQQETIEAQTAKIEAQEKEMVILKNRLAKIEAALGIKE